MQNENDVALLTQARSGDKRAFGELVMHYQGMVQRVARQMVRDDDLARDLAQEALLAAYLSLAQLRDNLRFASWLYGITLNVCRGYLRSRHLQTLTFTDIAGGIRFEALAFSSDMDPQTAAETRELHTRVLDAVNALSPENRAATLLFYYDGLSLDEISAVLQITVGAVKGRLHKSRTRLRQELMATYDEFRSGIQSSSRRTKMIPVTVADVVSQERPDAEGNAIPIFVVMLYDTQGQRTLPIWVGPAEGNAIALSLGGEPLPRPLTYEFITKILDAAGAQIESVRIDSLQGDIYIAVVTLKHDGNTMEIDARPSDAIALALRTSSPILVAEAVMERTGIPVPQPAEIPSSPRGVEKLIQGWQQSMQASRSTQTRTQQEWQQTQQELVEFVFGNK